MGLAEVGALVAWLGSAESGHVTGRVFEIEDGVISIATGWRHGPRIGRGARWNAADDGAAVAQLIADVPAPEPVYGSA